MSIVQQSEVKRKVFLFSHTLIKNAIKSAITVWGLRVKDENKMAWSCMLRNK
jgi:hypothetical protein